jgi:uncharacterized DUF497 family protein
LIFEWDEKKNLSNIQKHGIDFQDSAIIFEEAVIIKLDKRFDYGEDRWIGIGKLKNVCVVLVFTKRKSKNADNLYSKRKQRRKDGIS